MQADVPDRHAGQLHGRELGRRRERARLAHVHLDRLDHGGRLARGELERDRPAWVVGRGTEPPLVLERRDLDHRSVGIVAERIPVPLEPLAPGDDRVEIRARLGARIGLEPGRAQRLEDVPVGAEAKRVGATDVIEKDVERPPSGDRRVLLAHRPRGGVPRICERRRPRLLQRAVQLGELRARHEHLAAHFEDGGSREGASQYHRNRPDRPEVRRDVLAYSPVAPRRASDEAAALVEERDSEAVDLRLAHVRKGGARKGAADPRLEFAQLFGRGRVVEGEHGVVVLDRLEDVGRRPGHALRGAVRGDEIGEARLELAELAHQRVVFGVGDFGPGLDVVEVVVVMDLLAQLRDPLRGVGPRHARSITFSAGRLRRRRETKAWGRGRA